MIMCKAMVITKGLSVSAMTGQGLVWQDHDRQMPCMSARWQAQSLPVQVAVCGSPTSCYPFATLPATRRITNHWIVGGTPSKPNALAALLELKVSQQEFRSEFPIQGRASDALRGLQENFGVCAAAVYEEHDYNVPHYSFRIFHRADLAPGHPPRQGPTFGGLVEELEHIHCGRCVQLPKLAARRPQRLVADGQL